MNPKTQIGAFSNTPKGSQYSKTFMNGHLYNKDTSLIRILEGGIDLFLIGMSLYNKGASHFLK